MLLINDILLTLRCKRTVPVFDRRKLLRSHEDLAKWRSCKHKSKMMEVKNIIGYNNHQDIAAAQNSLQSTLSALPSWIGVLSEVSPILSGVASFGGFINSVVSARETAAFQQDLLSSLQSIQSTLNGIATDLSGIEATLQALATELQGLALSDKITSIENWGIYLAALPTDMTVPANLQGAQNLAASMMDADNGATNLQGCMLGIHDAMVGEISALP